jgi:hypothetical protein
MRDRRLDLVEQIVLLSPQERAVVELDKSSELHRVDLSYTDGGKTLQVLINIDLETEDE